MNRRLVGFLAAGAAGLLMTVTGLAWDLVLHSEDEGLATREGVLSLGNPAHLLSAVGLVLTAIGVAGAGLEALRSRAGGRRLPGWAVAACAASVALLVGILGGSALGGGGDDHGGEALAAAQGKKGQHRMAQYPDLAKATDGERAAAQRLYDEAMAATAPYRDPDAARAAGYRVDPDKRKPSGRPALAIHSPNRSYRDDGRVLDPSRPESLVYGKKGDGELVLIGALFVVAPGEVAPTPGGPITRWHTHRTGGPQMMHVWFTDDLRSAYARRPPVEVGQKYGVRLPSKAMGRERRPAMSAPPGGMGRRNGRMEGGRERMG